jgi:formylglycine-generating enzyme required for sulfatase activity
LGWLPPDLNTWVYCPGCAEDGGDLMAMKYPVTNAQFERFMLAGGYEQPAYWGGEDGEGWQYRGQYNWSQPRFWNHVRFGAERRGYPVVGVSWYEAAAYAAWLAELLEQALRQAQDTARRGKMELPPEDQALVADLLNLDALTVQLPAEAEWERLAGGIAADDRSPWDPPAGPATEEQAAILARANTEEAGLGGTSPVAMYPLGVSRPFGLLDLGGNVWEWTATWNDPFYILRGGSWGYSPNHARVGSRFGDLPYYRNYNFGFRLVSPVGSGS